jgi:glucose/mannose-6-phosphate isomerase
MPALSPDTGGPPVPGSSNAPILDNLEAMRQLDKSNVLGSIQALANQVEDAWDQVQQLNFNIDVAKIQDIVVTGMGGSALGPDIIKHVFKDSLSVPFEIINDYTLPSYVDDNTLVIASSYSGTTEETVAALEQAHQAGAQILVISKGGKLLEFAKQHSYGYYQIEPTHNPSNQPRMAVGYSVFGIIAMLSKIGLLKLTDEEVNRVIATIRRTTAQMDANVPQDNNPAKQLAFHILGRIPVFIGAEHLTGAIHVLQNQFNENGKTFAIYRVLPELNHHQLEGLRFPETNDHNLFFVLFQSNLYHPRTQKRTVITQQVLEGAGIESTLFKLENTASLEQVFEVITLGAFANFYLAMLEGVDPAPIEIVDFFKEELNREG